MYDFSYYGFKFSILKGASSEDRAWLRSWLFIVGGVIFFIVLYFEMRNMTIGFLRQPIPIEGTLFLSLAFVFICFALLSEFLPKLGLISLSISSALTAITFSVPEFNEYLWFNHGFEFTLGGRICFIVFSVITLASALFGFYYNHIMEIEVDE